jgi:hypothetical protein
MHGNTSVYTITGRDNMIDSTMGWDYNSLVESIPMPVLPSDIFPNQGNRNNSNSNRGSGSSGIRNSASSPSTMLPSWDFNNPWLDGDYPFEQFEPPGVIQPVPQEPITQSESQASAQTPVNTQNVNNAEEEFFHIITDEPVRDSGSGELITHNILSDDVGYGLEIPSYNPLSD